MAEETISEGKFYWKHIPDEALIRNILAKEQIAMEKLSWSW